MKNSDDWATQDKVDEAADAIVAEKGCSISEVRGYRVAKALGCDPGGALYERVRDWRQRRKAEIGATVIEVPPVAEAAFRAFLERMAAEAMAAFIQTVRSVGADIDRAAALRAVDGQRRASQAEDELEEVVTLWRTVEAEVVSARAQIKHLEQALRDAQRREDRLLGRLEQRDADFDITAAKGEAKDDPAKARSEADDDDDMNQYAMWFEAPAEDAQP